MKRTLLTAILIAWCLALGNATDGPVYHTKTYAKLLRKLDGGIVDASSRSLNFLYYEEYATSSTTCELRIFNAQSDLLSTTNLNVTPGSNLVEFNLSSTSLYPGGQKYWIKVTNKKGEKFFLRFKDIISNYFMKNFIAIGVSTITAIIIITIYHFFIVKKQVYIDLVKIYQEYDMSEALNQDLIDFQKGRKSELDSAYLSLSGKGNENDLRANLERQYYNLEKEISERDNRNQQLLAQKINENVKKFSAENNYQMIFGATGSGSILFADESLDITDEFLHFINTQYHDE